MNVDSLANVIASAVKMATSTVGMAERGVISGDTVVTSHGVYAYVAVCPIDLYNGKEVWLQISEEGNAVIIGD